jgi:hypothetical protein
MADAILDFVNGQGKPRVIMNNSTGDIPGTQILDYTFPLTQPKGHTETWTEVSIEDELITITGAKKLSYQKELIGHWGRWYFDWSEYSLSKADLQNLAFIRNNQNSVIFKLIPRSDYPDRFFLVKVILGSLEIRLAETPDPRGNRGASIGFQTVETQSIYLVNVELSLGRGSHSASGVLRGQAI